MTDPALHRRLDQQFAFLNEADRLKSVLRATTLCDGSRRENSGEHSWHLALYAMVLADQAAPGVDISRVIRMLLIHDLVEIDVGDVPIHSANGQAHASAQTQAAEQRVAFGVLGVGQVEHLVAQPAQFLGDAFCGYFQILNYENRPTLSFSLLCINHIIYFMQK